MAVGLGPPVLLRSAGARSGSLTLAKEPHFAPAFDDWFDGKFVKEWGERNGVRVTVDHMPVGTLRARAATEVAAQRGHDLFAFVTPPSAYEAQVVPLNDVVGECERRFGRLVPLARQGTYNPRTRNYFALADSWAPAPLHYRSDWWTDVGVKPDTWEQIREGARTIKEKHGALAGFGLAPEPDSDSVLRGLLWSYGAAEQDEDGRVTINSRATVEAIKLMTAIYQESMSADVFAWDPSSNNRAFVWGKASIIQNAISALRTAEKQSPEVARKTALGLPAAGPKARLTSVSFLHCYVIWKFAENRALGKRFLVDLIAASDEAFLASEFYHFPTFARSVTTLRGKLGADTQNPRAYLMLADAERWSVCPGFPGPTTAAIEEVFHASVIANMFARAARGEQGAEDSARQAELEMRRVFEKWAKWAR